MTIETQKLPITWLNMLILALCLHLLIIYPTVSGGGDLRPGEDVKKESFKSKKPIIEKKSDLKSTKSKSILATGALIDTSQIDPALNVTFEEDNLWDNNTEWFFKNGTNHFDVCLSKNIYKRF